jgi:DeoR/GlpR family transcriptional regulator of sugar metabolism
MLSSERKMQILDYINKNGTVSIMQLAGVFNVSEMTIRRDLDDLDKQNAVKRIHGGAMKFTESSLQKKPFDDRKVNYFEEKRRIGIAAASLVNDKDTILLDFGTTTMEVAKNLGSKKDIFTVTNSIPIAVELSKHKNGDVLMIGGFIRDYNQLNLVGNHTLEILEKFSVDKLFLGAMGFHPTRSLVYYDIEETVIRNKMIKISKEVNVVIDSSKFGKDGLYSIGSFSKIDTIITDDKISKVHIDFCISKGIKLLVVGEEDIQVY